jgi:hypothetical protein
MSGIKYEVLAGDDLISALRGGRAGDLLDDAAYAAADEIERLQRVLQKVMARCADLLDEDQFNELDAIASSASGVQYKPCEICTTQSWCETHGCQCYPAEAICCLDYPRCDCNSPPEPAQEPKGCNHFPGQVNCEWCTEVPHE